MDAHLFADLVPDGTLSENGPQNRRRAAAYVLSLWFNADHEAFPSCRFEDYLSLRGWNQELLLKGQWRAAHPDNPRKSDDDVVFDAIAVIQAWMTLGFLEDLYQSREWLKNWRYLRSISEHEFNELETFISRHSGLRRLLSSLTGTFTIFNTQKLVSNLFAMGLIRRLGSFYSGPLTSQHFARLPNLITQYAHAFNDLTSLRNYDEDRNQTRYPINPDTESASWFLYTMSLPKLIYEAVTYVLQDLAPDIDLNDTKTEPLLIGAMQEQNGWCPHIIEKLSNNTRYTVLHWLWASDFNSLDDRNHLSCTTSKCHAVDVSSESEYPERHVGGCDRKCARVYVDLNQVVEALSCDRIPVVVAQASSSDPSVYTFRISSFNPILAEDTMPYVAFSHVWSDGLGSTTEKGIPSCQAYHLAQVASIQSPTEDQSVAFWIDSICIPSALTARQKAIQLLSSTYKRARTVVVLDATLAKTSLYDQAGRFASLEYLLFRIYTSPWSQRIWTYQEGVLAQKLLFLLADNQFVPLDFPPDIEDGSTRGPLYISRGRDSLRIVYIFLRTQVQALNGQLRPINIGIVAEELRWRDTLHRNPNGRNDEILATSVVLNLDLTELQKEPEGPARIVCFYQLVGRWYRNIIFAEAPRLQIDGFRWAPSTFLTSDPRRPHVDLDQLGVDCVKDGLIGEYITFACADGQEILYDDSKRVTLVDERSTFDIAFTLQKAFSFTHILIYPQSVPESTRRIMFVAVAVREDTEYSITHHATRQIDLVGTFQTVIHVGWVRQWDTPVLPSRFPNGAQVVNGTWQKMTVLLR